MSIKYRPEIDGLRAVAVVSVLLAHANFSLFAGGFVGVDIFFVISGFLITSLIVRDLEQEVFSFTNFWERRIRRILPPLIVVVAATLIAGWFLYLPVDYKMLGEQTAAQSVFASNILFKRQAGYFDTENIIKPLLHTWSLAVEEQFYLFFPIAIFYAWKYRREKVFKYFSIFAAVSFVAASWLVRNSPSSAFYLLPFRAWELMLGSLLALKRVYLHGIKKEIAGWAGLVAIAASVFLYNDKILFPGVTALLPCLGAAAIIVSNANGLNGAGKILSMRLPVFIGLVSYSLYLWHWPIMAFTRYSGLIDFTPMAASLCMAAAFVLAILTWKFVETPFRQKRILSETKNIYRTAFTVLVALLVIGACIYSAQGLPQRLPEDVVKYAAGAEDTNPYRDSCNKPKFDRFENGNICQSNAGKNIEPSFVLWGDSFADSIAPAFYELSKEYNRNGYVVTAHGCPPIFHYFLDKGIAFDCPGFNDRVFALIKNKNIKHVFIVANWTDKLRGSADNFRDIGWYNPYKKDFANIPSAGLAYTIDELQKHGIKVYLMADVPFAQNNPPRFLAITKLYNRDDITANILLETYRAGRGQLLDPFLKQNKNKNIVILDPEKLLCDGDYCRVEDEGKSLYYNQGHLSVYGAEYLKPMFEGYFRKGF